MVSHVTKVIFKQSLVEKALLKSKHETKWYINSATGIILLSIFHLNAHALGFHPQTLKLEPGCTA